MALLNIRNLSENVHRQLRLRAAKHARSMEAEAREILTAVCATPHDFVSAADLQAYVTRIYGTAKPPRVVGALIRERRRQAERE